MKRLLAIFAVSLSCLAAELPQAPQPPQPDHQQQAIDATSAQSLIRGSDGKLQLARWTLSLYAEHDSKGWGPSSRVDCRLNNRFGLVATEVKKTVSAGFTVRLGALK